MFGGRKSWLEEYLAFRTENPLPLVLPSKGVKIVEEEDTGLHNDMEQATYFFLQPTGLMYGTTVSLPFPEEIYPKNMVKNSQRRGFLIFTEALMACMVADRHFMLEGLEDEEDRFRPALVAAAEFFSGRSLGQEAEQKGIPQKVIEVVEKKFLDAVYPKIGMFQRNDLLRSGFLFLDLHGAIEWQRKKAMNPDMGSEDLAEIHQDQLIRRSLLLQLLVEAIRSAGEVKTEERKMLEFFLKSSGLPEHICLDIHRGLQEGIELDHLDFSKQPWLVRRYFLEVILLAVMVDHELSPGEEDFLHKAIEQLELWNGELRQSQSALEVFMIGHTKDLPFLRKRVSPLNLHASLQRRALEALKMNLDRIVNEVKETQELSTLLVKATHTNLSKEEKDKVQEQLMDILKTIPALAVFSLPGGAIILPLLIKLLPFNVLPSSFND